MTDGEGAAGRCLMVGFEGTSLDAETRASLVRLAPGGIILFRRNLETPERLADLVTELGRALHGPLLLALDEEGGRVSRLAPWLGPTPPAASIARAGEAAARRFGTATAEALRTLGFNVDLAPVVDLSEPDAPNGIGDRSFGTDPGSVTRLAGAFLAGLQEAGVAGCLKHFPGQGRARLDAHVSRPTIDRRIEDLEREELVPFRALSPRAALVMVGHGHYPALDPDRDIPASLSPVAVRQWLRGRLGFEGLIASDDMEMGAVAGFEGSAEDAVAAMHAGCDLLLYCRDLERAARSAEALARTARADPSFAARLEEARSVVSKTAGLWPRVAPDMTAWAHAREAVIEAARLVGA